MSQLSVMLITGGISGERKVSLTSAHHIWQGLETLDLACCLAFVDEKGRWFLIENPSRFFSDPNSYPLHDQSQLSWRLGARSYAQTASCMVSPDVVFPMVHGTLGEDGALQGFLTMANLPFVGCDILGAAVNMHKGVAKRLWKHAGLPVVPWLEVSRGQSCPSWSSCVAHLGEHLFVKVDNQGSSLGVYEVTSELEYVQAVEQSMSYGNTVLIEQATIGREIEVAILLESEPVVSLPGEIQLQEGFYDFSAKYDQSSAAIVKVPADLTGEEISTARLLALQAAKASYCRTYARVDLFLANGDWFINEINTIPGFTSISLYPKLMAHEGIGLSALLLRMIHDAVRHDSVQVSQLED